MAQCVQCGYCCRIPCLFGHYNKEKTACAYLTKENLCGIYERIKSTVPDWDIYPAFGVGCSSTIGNSVRTAKMQEIAGAHG